MTSRYISVEKTNGLITGGTATYIEIWNVPDDFSESEVELLRSICEEGKLHASDAYDRVRSLR